MVSLAYILSQWCILNIFFSSYFYLYCIFGKGACGVLAGALSPFGSFSHYIATYLRGPGNINYNAPWGKQDNIQSLFCLVKVVEVPKKSLARSCQHIFVLGWFDLQIQTTYIFAIFLSCVLRNTPWILKQFGLETAVQTAIFSFITQHWSNYMGNKICILLKLGNTYHFIKKNLLVIFNGLKTLRHKQLKSIYTSILLKFSKSCLSLFVYKPKLEGILFKIVEQNISMWSD